MQNRLPHPTIKHVVVLMLENRGFDHVMGWLYEANESPRIVTREGDTRRFLGLSTLSQERWASLANPLPGGGTVLPRRGARSPKTPSFNPGESFAHIFNQMWGVAEDSSAWKNPQRRAELLGRLSHHGAVEAPMTGFVLDYRADVFHHTGVNLDAEGLSEILDTYAPAQLPVLNGLARYYAVSDEWFCSVPSQTNTNRAFSMAGTSRGLVNNSFYDPFASTWNPGVGALKMASEGVSNADGLPVSTRTLFEVLQQAGFNWKVYWQDTWPPGDVSHGLRYQYVRTMFPLLADKGFDGNFVRFDAADPRNVFYEDLRNGRLPALSWIEPKWGGGPRWDTPMRAVGNDMHPACDTTTAEDFIKDVYEALVQSPAWPETLLVITFDENGGTYDHLAPRSAMASGNDQVPLPTPKTGDVEMDAATRTQFGFDFRQFGARVPTLLVSPRVSERTLFRSTTATPYDHTSIIATVLTMANVDRTRWQMGERVANAPTFEQLLTDPLRAIPNPGEALNAPGRDARHEALRYNTPYVFEYVGDPWLRRPGPVYLGRAKQGISGLYYPTLTTDADRAVRLRLQRAKGNDDGDEVSNMAGLVLDTTESSWAGFTHLAVSPELPCVYYSRDPAHTGATWQIRILSSRDSGQTVNAGEQVYFVSCLGPRAYQSVSARMTPDPLQRLMPYPEDGTYLSTRAGEWALWRLVRAVGDDNV